MVGNKDDGMVYVMSITTAGQVTIPKALRERLGVTTTVEMRQRGDKIVIERTKTLREKMAEIRAGFSDEERAAIRRNAGKTANQLRKEMEATPEGRAYARRVYGA